MKLRLGAFGRTGVDMQAQGDVAGAVSAAIAHYAAQIGSGRTTVKFPAFCRLKAVDCMPVDVEAAMEADIRAILEREAWLQRLRLDQLIEHAVFVYLADLDSENFRTECSNPELRSGHW